MRTGRVYQELARDVQAWKNCEKDNNLEWGCKYEERIKKLLDELPHGSGVDSDWWFDYKNSNLNVLIFGNSYHFMNERGFYDGWIDFTVKVTASLAYGFVLQIKGKFDRVKHYGIRDHLYEIIDEALNREVKK